MLKEVLFRARSHSQRSGGWFAIARLCWLTTLLGAGTPGTAFALYEYAEDQGSLSLMGAAKLFPTYTRTRGGPESDPQNLWATLASLRLSLEGETGKLVGFEAAYHVFPIVYDEPGEVDGFGASQSGLFQPSETLLRLVDFDRTLTRGDHATLQHNLDRLSIALFTEVVDIRIGRQAIGHGSARLFSCTDIFSPFSPATLDNEFKQGIDAATLALPIGESTEFGAIAVGHRERLLDGIYLGRFQHTFAGLDVSGYAGASYASPTVGFDVSGDVMDATLYGELFYRRWRAAPYRRAALTPPLGSPPRLRENALRATVGAHYYFELGLNAVLELHYNGTGARQPADYAEVVMSPEWQAGETFLLGRYYVGLSLTYELYELVSLGLSTLGNVRDPSALLVPSVLWDTSDNTSLSLGAMAGVGRTIRGTLPRSEFGLYPYTAYIDARWYF